MRPRSSAGCRAADEADRKQGLLLDVVPGMARARLEEEEMRSVVGDLASVGKADLSASADDLNERELLGGMQRRLRAGLEVVEHHLAGTGLEEGRDRDAAERHALPFLELLPLGIEGRRLDLA